MQRDVYSSSLEAHFDQSFARFYLLSTASSDACDIGSGTFQGEPQSRSFSSAGQRAGVLGWPDGVPAFGPVICFLHWYRDVDADVSAYVQPWHSWTNTWFHVVARVGEALNPGPSAFCIGVANPSGLRCKEEVCLDHPVGILNLCETQLSYVTQASCRRRLQALAANAGRHLRTIFGSPVVTRANSEWAGSWSGVAALSDFPCRPVQLSWHHHEWISGRVLASQHFVGHLSLLNVAVYGYPQSPTWPQAKQKTASLLQSITTEIVVGSTGPRVVCGDLNMSTIASPIFDVWRSYGWQEAQEWALQRWGQEIQMTCKGRTCVDHVWLSPEALALCQAVEVRSVFAEHSSVLAFFDFAQAPAAVMRWPCPSRLPLHSLSAAWPSTSPEPLSSTSTNSDALFAQWASSFENSFNGHVLDQPASNLVPQQRGRFGAQAPRSFPATCIASRPSRRGEVALRNNRLGSVVSLWFKQLRRLQSYKQAIEGGKTTSSALTYRIELWSSILAAKGFSGSFRQWWNEFGRHGDPDAPSFLPSGPPARELAGLIFVSFKTCFEACESWHLHQRLKLLRAKHDRTLHALFVDLKPPSKAHLDVLWQEQCYSVIGADSDSQQLHLDRPLALGGSSTWTIDDVRVSVLSEGNDVCTVVPFPADPCEVVLVQHQTLTQLSDLHEELCHFWLPRWQQFEDLPSDRWDRIIGFFRAYLPRLSLHVPPLTLSTWRSALRRFGVRSARGVDGFSPAELLKMPDSWTQQLLDLLGRITLGELAWPAAIRFGTVFSLAKRASAHLAGDFRPVVIFSVIYRCWSGIQARALLHQLEPYVNSESFGFLPQREAAQHWMALQGQIEVAVLLSEDLCGFSSDLSKAFEHIPRPQTMALSRHLQVPETVLRPWSSFLDTCVRAFDVRGSLSPALPSKVGMPEGDALSVFAMVQLDFSWHVYMKAFCPAVRSSSYVDNLGVRGISPFDLLEALCTTSNFFELWNLSLDHSKTYCWGTTKAVRAGLSIFPHECKDTAAELGGSMSYTARHRNSHQRERLCSLDERWTRLRFSQATVQQKLRALPICFWSKALHGAASCRLSLKLIQDLRIAALRALRLLRAGSNSVLQLTLSGVMTADPGFFQLQYTVHCFRRICCKMAQFFHDWNVFMQLFSGVLHQGPFSKLLEELNNVGWSLSLPWLWTHDDLCFDFLQMDSDTLSELLEEAWLGHVARLVRGRKTMSDLKGLDRHLLWRHRQPLTALQLARLGALQSGAFMDRSRQSKFDLTKSGRCPTCSCPETQEHWLTCPAHEASRRQAQLSLHAVATCQLSLKLHLLPSRNPHLPWLRSYFHGLPRHFDMLAGPSSDAEHVFTDGSCFQHGYGGAQAAWAVLSATSGRPLAQGHLSGVRQTVMRAEITAALCALTWSAEHQVFIHLWIDNQAVVTNLLYLIQHHRVSSHWINQDLWREVLEALEAQVREPRATWIPSHLDETLCTSPYESWFCFWNDRVDRLAVSCNEQRSEFYYQKLQAANQYAEDTMCQMGQLFSFYSHVAEEAKDSEVLAEPQTSEDTPEMHFCVTDKEALSSFLPGQFSERLTAIGHMSVPNLFISRLLSWLVSQEDAADGTYACSFLELVFMLISSGVDLPLKNPSTGCWEHMDYFSMPIRPTVASLIRMVRLAVKLGADVFGYGELLFFHQNKVALGIHSPCSGLFLRLNSSLVKDTRFSVHTWTSSWPIRRVADLARPFPVAAHTG